MDTDNRLGWRPALDGLRAIAVVCVVLFHFRLHLLPGGSLGVDLFFALSGFLITSLLVEEWLTRGGVSLTRFYARRALRLMPALIAFLAVVSIVQILLRDVPFTRQPSVTDTLENAGYSAAYVYNWLVAFRQLETGAFAHLWSLSIEEQFYLLWPVGLAFMLRARLPLPAIIAVTAGLAAASASVPVVVGTDSWHRLYYGTDYRMHGLLIGSIAGLLFTHGYVTKDVVRHPAFLAALIAGIVYVALLMLFANERASLLYAGGYPAVALAFAVIVLAAARVERGLPLLLLANGMVRYIGRRSYAIYLWHFPIAMWTYSLGAWPQLFVAGALTLAAAELSWRLVEAPALSLRSRMKPQSSHVDQQPLTLTVVPPKAAA